LGHRDLISAHSPSSLNNFSKEIRYIISKRKKKKKTRNCYIVILLFRSGAAGENNKNQQDFISNLLISSFLKRKKEKENKKGIIIYLDVGVAVVVAAAVVAVVVGWRPLDATPVHTYTHNREKMNFNKERKKRTTRWADMVCKSPAFFFRSGDVIAVWNRKEKTHIEPYN
jgi:hypothetical protein